MFGELSRFIADNRFVLAALAVAVFWAVIAVGLLLTDCGRRKH